MDMKYGSLEDWDRHIPYRLIFSFIAAALRGETTCRGMVTRDVVEDALEHRREHGVKPLVFFLDEFPDASSEGKPTSEKELRAHNKQERLVRAMRNAFLLFGLPVVISSTNGSGRGLPWGPIWSRGFPPYVWCDVIPSLPAVTLDEACLEAIPDPFKIILQHSRPLFALDALTYLQEHTASTDLGGCLDNLVNWLCPRLHELKKPSDSFEWGQLGLLLCCSFSLADEYTDLIDAHFARLTPLDPFELIVDSSNDLWLKRQPWLRQCECTYSAPESDLLLHVALTSGHTFPPLKDPLHQMMQPSMLQLMRFDSSCDRSNEDMIFEALTTAAFVLASRHGGVQGVRFTVFMQVLLFELGVVSEPKGFQLSSGIAASESSTLVVPFLSPPNTPWPEWFLTDWGVTSANFANLSSSANSDRVDFRVSSDVFSGEYSNEFDLLEAEEMVRRISDSSSIHLVVAERVKGAILKAAIAKTVVLYHISKGSNVKLLAAAGDRERLVFVIELAATRPWRSLLKEKLPAVVSRWL